MSCGSPRVPASPLRVTRGASKVFLFTVRVDPATGVMTATVAGVDPTPTVGNLVDLTGAKVWFTVKNRVEDVAALVAKKSVAAGGVDNQVTVVSPQSGATLAQFKVFVDPADTFALEASSQWCDAWVELPGGPPINRQQVSANREFVVDPAVTSDF